ncbi:uncharacterized protein K02A2.6-like [Mercenaria mercenaria]|uniref:uncharacterized protein K02A2.6-like n=1 Tax=Mercenaria mercenaria TaxID=6596 RepID=UPI00234F430A|nr:uncharacterized protein K02A2.6-like [Mercenaria mercenaria]
MGAHVHTVLKQLPVSDQKLEKIRIASQNDDQVQTLIQVIRNGWPRMRQDCPKSVVEYWNHRDELSFENGLIFKGQKIIIPRSERFDMIKAVHDNSHQGCNQATRRASDIMFWPGMSNQILEYVQACSLCEKYRPSNAKEPLFSHEVPQRPWQNVSCDIFAFDNKQYLITVCAFSRFFEIDLLPNTKSNTVIRKLKVHFSRFGIPEQLKSDNGPQFTSEPFSNFARDWHFTHVTSSPHHQSSNGLSEIYVKLAKRILQKAKDANCDPYLPLLEHRNSPLPAIGYSPSQLLQGRRLRSILPATHEQLSPKPINAKKARENMQKQQTRSKFYYDRSTQSLPSLQSGENITFQKTPGEKWEPG